MTAQPDAFRVLFAKLGNLIPQALAIARCITRARRTMRTLLPKGQIIPNHFDFLFRKCVCDRYQKRSISIRSSSMRENQIFQKNVDGSNEKGRLPATALS